MTIGTNTCIPGKRLRNWHRRERRSGEHAIALRAYARMLARLGETSPDRERQVIARAWLSGKAIQP